MNTCLAHYVDHQGHCNDCHELKALKAEVKSLEATRESSAWVSEQFISGSNGTISFTKMVRAIAESGSRFLYPSPMSTKQNRQLSHSTEIV